MPAWLAFIMALIQGASTVLEAQKNTTAAAVGTDLGTIDAVTLAILQANAQVRGATIDWTNPSQVAAYVATLPVFTPIPAPAAAPAPGPTPAPGSTT